VRHTFFICMALLALPTAAAADDAAQPVATKSPPVKTEPAVENATKPPGDVQMSGMSVLGNDEAPKSLVIVPWKSSQLGDMPGLSKLLDDSTQPVDKEVFMRELAYYRIKSESK
jgi:hypothetical protein